MSYKAFSFLLLAVLCTAEAAHDHDQQHFERRDPPDFCLSGPFHKARPSPEEEEFHECLSWQSKACCNLRLSMTINQQKAIGLYNYSWDLCGNLSKGCENFIKDEECFYQCEPMLGYFEDGVMTGRIQNVPVCASYCDRWFEACKDDFTCVEDWLADFQYHPDHNYNSCPQNLSCITFRQMYGNAEGLCNKMWGKAFFYERDESNCTVMAFNNTRPNPNFLLRFPDNSGSSMYQVSLSILWLVFLLAAFSV